MATHKSSYKLADLLPLAEMVRDWIAATGQRVEICGSLRRRRPVVGDVDLVISGPLSSAIDTIRKAADNKQCELINLCNIQTCKVRGTVIVDGVQVDLYISDHENWGAMTLFLTGSKVLNILMRQRAKELEYRLNQYGLFHNGDIIAGKTEEQIFMALGIPFLTPEQRSLEYGDQLPKEGEHAKESRKDGKPRRNQDRSRGAKSGLPLGPDGTGKKRETGGRGKEPDRRATASAR